MNCMDHIEANNKVTLKSLIDNRTPVNLNSVMDRFNDVYEMVKDYLTVDMKILDLGTKDGLLFDLLTEKYGFDKEKMIGYDCCEEVVKICQDKGYLVYKADILNIPETAGHSLDQQYDFVFIIHTLEHVPDPIKAVSEITRMLKPNGYVFVEVPLQSEPEEPELWGHYYQFTSFKQILELFHNYKLIKHDWQKTKSKKPWYRSLFQKDETTQ